MSFYFKYSSSSCLCCVTTIPDYFNRSIFGCPQACKEDFRSPLKQLLQNLKWIHRASEKQIHTGTSFTCKVPHQIICPALEIMSLLHIFSCTFFMQFVLCCNHFLLLIILIILLILFFLIWLSRLYYHIIVYVSYFLIWFLD